MERRNFLAAIGGLLGLGAVAKAADVNGQRTSDGNDEVAARLKALNAKRHKCMSANEARDVVGLHKKPEPYAAEQLDAYYRTGIHPAFQLTAEQRKALHDMLANPPQLPFILG